MSLASVHMPADVYYACTLHALSVEEEEVMGLLIGKVNYLKNFKIMKNKNLYWFCCTAFKKYFYQSIYPMVLIPNRYDCDENWSDIFLV